ncbi:MAG TPA: hypothetical protein VEU50_23465 [Archangium sp.]|nr:hypothetical protein [Archangium sp.]
MTRRRLLAAGLGGGALLLVGSGLRWFTSGYQLLPGEASVGLSVKELCVVRSLVEMFFPASGALPSGVALGVHQRIDEEVWSQPQAMREDLQAAIQLIEHAPLLLGFSGRMSSLDLPEREKAFQRLLASDRDVVVQAAVALKQMAHLFYYGHPDTWKAIGYDGPWQPRPLPPESSARYQSFMVDAAGRLARGERS